MPTTHTAGGTGSAVGGARPAKRATKPIAEPMAKHSAERRSGGTSPDASVRSASSAHTATAENPISVARPTTRPLAPWRREAAEPGLLAQCLEAARRDGERADFRRRRYMDRRVNASRSELR